ncbi:hypothetical protein NFI96_023409, partial [Prochilodus magdalenae]
HHWYYSLWEVTTSGDIQNLTITITGLQERDSGVYSCVYNSLSRARVTEKETNGVLLVVKGYVTKNRGETLTMVCTTEDADQLGLYLYARRPEKHAVLYYDKSTKEVTPTSEYIGRVTTSGDIQNLTITITGLQERDSGVYSCVYNSLSGARVTEKEANGVLLVVKGSVTKSRGESLTMVCTTEDADQIALYLYARRPEKHAVLYYDKSTNKVTPTTEYMGRVTTSGDIQNLTITITGLQERDSAVYSCVYNSLSGARVTEKETNAVLLVVK